MNIRSFWTCKLGTQERIKVPIWILVDFQQKDRRDWQNLEIDTFYRHPVTNDQCITGIKKYPDSTIWLNFEDDGYSQGYGQIEEALRILTKDGILNPFLSDHDFRSTKIKVAGETTTDFGYNLYVFDIRF